MLASMRRFAEFSAVVLRAVALALLAGLPLLAPAQVNPLDGPVRFGILPLGGAFESRSDWDPLLAELSRAINRPVSVLSVNSYEALEQAIMRNEVDMAFLSGKMALDAVTQRRMKVVAQVVRHDGLPGYRALLLARKAPPFNSLKNMLDQPERWRLARGEKQSVSGFIVPQLQLFLPNHIAMETRFGSEIVGTHQATALAVANNEADVATNNTADFERFKLRFPAESERLQVLWESELIPHAQIVVRSEYAPELRKRVQTFLTGYGRVKGPRGDAERAVLKSLHDLAGFVAADNSSLQPAAKLAYQLAKQNAMTAQWVNDAAREARLQRIESSYADQVAVLKDVSP
ncbi:MULTISPECIES: phosphate/phosphite/phosphonate ABC transporter substrate-binding protein [unclassified Variovorax]|jgi:phosphonate transport system substrate-binding protein|uniref:phosphate/phosphite/phosphonate ABC transporter substrate-binding protein n=1 Tax=unclassified Variovorax TaxID=663243 RepID=UPI000F7E393B|nr:MULTISPECIES: phosphate/phosphite/phosphonate ABC transporter substrate-binding protein [unclassified Variovorax]RSZ42692.1 phosphate/phosphite/phosphonate ABC transporter substrate-binding protein [Variovorax sp. 553]RSZ43666.1 phosphate/phosphite/phosphonate ABC transporter substrate-binding protein [Variovorax sp. 679]